jgi:hypothetical protein
MATAPRAFDGDIETCPPHWPPSLWELLKHKKQPGPVYRGYDDILSALMIHALSYDLADQQKAQQLRSIAEDAVPPIATRLSEVHQG